MRNSTLCFVFVALIYSAQAQMQFTNNALVQVTRATTLTLLLTTNDHEKALQPFSPLGIKATQLFEDSYIKAPYLDEKGEKLVGGLWIQDGEKLYQYQNKELYYSDNLIGKPESKNLDKLLGYLQKLERKSPYAKNIIRTLETSINQFTIKISTCENSYMVLPIKDGKKGILNNNAYAFQVMETDELVVDYAPFDRIGSSAEIRWNPEDKIIKIAHELSHAYDANFGLMDDRMIMVDGQVMLSREVRAIYHENMIRKELKKNLRNNVHGVKMMIVDGEPITYPLPYIARH